MPSIAATIEGISIGLFYGRANELLYRCHHKASDPRGISFAIGNQINYDSISRFLNFPQMTL